MSLAKRSLVVIFALLIAAPTAAQDSNLAAPCPMIPGEQARAACVAVAQAAESAQPQIGMVIAGGNPVIGAASTGGLRFGAIPRIDLTVRVNLVFIELPDILAAEAGPTIQRLNQRLGVPAPAFAASGSVGVLQGFSVMPGIGGIGSLDVLGSGAWLPFRAFNVDGFDTDSPDLAWGIGARLGLLRESFVAPGVSLSLMYRALGRVAFGDVCPGHPLGGGDVVVCPVPGDVGEFAFDLRNWSTRGVVGKRFLGFGLLGGFGYDRYHSDIDFAFRGEVLPDIEAGGHRVYRFSDLDVSSSRWSVFGNFSYTFLLTSLSLEAGWQQGGSPVPGFAREARFDPRSGNFFGGAGVRLSF
jgi:hypothetical protein